VKTVLLLEPDRETADIIAEYMQQQKLHAGISHALTSQEAVHLADQVSPDIVITELAVAEHNGLAFLHEFRSYSDWSDIPILIHSMIPPEQAGLSAADMQHLGVVRYLYKPTTSLEKLHHTIVEVLEK
jgi:DNA-binding response OmpR family regulator